MKFSLSKQSSESVGLDIDDRCLAAAVIDGGSVGRMASVDLERGVVADGEVKDPEALTAVLKEMFTRFKLPRRVRLGVANQQIVVRQLDMPMIEDANEQAAAVRFQAAEAIAMPLEDAVLDFQPIGVSETPEGTRQRLLVVAARESMISRLLAAVKGAGLKPDGIDLSAFALVRILGDSRVPDPGVSEPARVICHLGGITNLAIAAGPVCLFTRPLRTVWSSEDEHAVSSLAEEIRLSIEFHMAQPGACPVDRVVLSGPGATDERLVAELGATMALPVSVGEPLGAVSADAVPSTDDPYRYTVAAGLALGVER